jgi:hypothetical protein
MGGLRFPALEGFPAHEQRGREVPWLPQRVSAKGTAPCSERRGEEAGAGQRKKKGEGMRSQTALLQGASAREEGAMVAEGRS